MHADERRRRRLYPLLVGFLSLVVIVLPAVGGGGAGGKAAGPAARLGPRPAAAKTVFDPLTYSPAREQEFEQRAAAGFAHAVYMRAPGGALATARHIAHWRPVIERTAQQAGLDPNLLEGLVWVEWAERHADPQRTLGIATQYLSSAESELGRQDLAVASFRIGTDNLQRALDAYGQPGAPYAQLYFDSSPLHNPDAWKVISGWGDDASTYLFRVMAAEDIMALYRRSPAQVAHIADLQDNKASGEEVMHPRDQTQRFADPLALSRAEAARELVPLDPAFLRAHGIVIDKHMGELAPMLHQAPALYRFLRPEAYAVVAYIGSTVRKLAGGGSLTLTSTVRDDRYQKQLSQRNAEATHNFSMHTTGWAFDFMRQFSSPEQESAFWFVMTRLTALDLVQWLGEPGAIHTAVGAQAKELLPSATTPASAARAARAPQRQ
jgi:hypothetical protein